MQRFWMRSQGSGYVRVCKSDSQLTFCFADGTHWRDGYATLYSFPTVTHLIVVFIDHYTAHMA